MKKLMLLLAVVFAFTVSASEEAVKKTVLFYREATARLDGLTALKVCAPEYEEINGSSRLNYEQTRKAAIQLHNLLNAKSLEEILIAQKKLAGQQPSAEELAQMRALKGSDQEKEIMRGIKNNFNAARSEAAKLLKKIEIKDIRINGNRASARQVLVHPMTGKEVFSDYQLIKRDGKWWITRISGVN